MQIGMPILIETKSIEACAVLCRELGLAFVELNMNLPEYQADILYTNYFRELTEEYGIYYTLHLDENLNPFDFNEWVSKAYMDTVLCAIMKAKQLSVPIMNMHLHDASGRSNHLILGDGDVDICKYLDLAKTRDCRIVLEVKAVDGLRRSARWLKERGYLCVL